MGGWWKPEHVKHKIARQSGGDDIQAKHRKKGGRKVRPFTAEVRIVSEKDRRTDLARLKAHIAEHGLSAYHMYREDTERKLKALEGNGWEQLILDYFKKGYTTLRGLKNAMQAHVRGTKHLWGFAHCSRNEYTYEYRILENGKVTEMLRKEDLI